MFTRTSRMRLLSRIAPARHQLISCFWLALALAGMLAAAPVFAKNWSELTPAQQEALGPLSREWDKLPKKQQRYYLDLARSYPTLTPEKKQRMHDNLERWSKLTPEQREQARQKYKAFRKVPPATREEVKQMVREQEAQKAASSPSTSKPADSAKPGAAQSEH